MGVRSKHDGDAKPTRSLSHLQVRTAQTSPQILLLTASQAQARSFAHILPPSTKSQSFQTFESFDPREDIRKLLLRPPQVGIGTAGRALELTKGRRGGGGSTSALRLDGVRWIGVEEGAFDDEEARKGWDFVVRAVGAEFKARVLSTIFCR